MLFTFGSDCLCLQQLVQVQPPLVAIAHIVKRQATAQRLSKQWIDSLGFELVDGCLCDGCTTRRLLLSDLRFEVDTPQPRGTRDE